MVREVANSIASEERLTMTYEEFLAWAGEETRAEWVDGEVIILDMPKPPHQRIILFLATLMSHYSRLLGLGEVLIAPVEMRLLSVRSSREPDIAFVAADHLERITSDRIEGPADLVVEVISPDSVTRDRRDKFREYAAAGIGEYWTIDSRQGRRDISASHLTGEGIYETIELDADGRLHSVVLTGFWIDPRWLHQDPLPDPLTTLMMIAPAALSAAIANTSSPSQT